MVLLWLWIYDNYWTSSKHNYLFIGDCTFFCRTDFYDNKPEEKMKVDELESK
jgi:hypothetical protein